MLNQACKLSGDCIKGLVCSHDNTCVALKEKRAVIGDECQTDADCQSPSKLTCQVIVSISSDFPLG